MKHTRKSRKSTTLVQKLFETGHEEDKFDINAFKMLLEKHGYLTLIQLESIYKIILKISKPKKKKEAICLLESFISESLQINNIPTWNDNENYFRLLSQIQKLSQTLDQESTSIGRDLPPWYEKFAETKSLKLLLPTKIDCADSRSNCSNWSVKNTIVPSWFTVKESSIMTDQMKNLNLKMISSPLLMYSSPVITEKEQLPLKKNEKDSKTILDKSQQKVMRKSKKSTPTQLENNSTTLLIQQTMPQKITSQEDLKLSLKEEKSPKLEPNGIIKVRLYPTEKQESKLNKLIDANRYAWNLLVEKMGNKVFALKQKELETEFRHLVKKSNIDKQLSISECPEECFDSAYRDVLKARKAVMAASKAKKLREGKGFSYPESLNFKTKKEGKVSVELRGRTLKYNSTARTISLFKQYFEGNHHIKMKTNLAKLGLSSFQYSCRLTKRNDHYYLMVPYRRIINPTQTKNICAIDPGVRTFLTGYDPRGLTFEIAGNNDHIHKKKQKIEQLQKILKSTIKEIKKKRISQEIRNLYRKITNCVADLHHKSAKILADTYHKILLPKFETQDMAKNDGNRKINATTAYYMLTLSHYKFQQLLKHKMELRAGELILCTEEYTSKTCGNCGRINHELGASKVFKCPFEDCNVVMDRDINGARNILIKNHELIDL